MKRKKRNLALEEREVIQNLLQQKYTMHYIATVLNRNPCSIHREIKRYTIDGVYDAKKAHDECTANMARTIRKPGNMKELFNDLETRMSNMEMHIDILIETIKELQK